MKSLIKAFLILSLFNKCGMDYNCTNEIINTKNKSVKLEIQYDKNQIDSIKGRFNSTSESKFSFLNKQGNISGKKFQIDTNRFSVTYILLKDDTVAINKTVGGRLIEPDYSQIKNITIHLDSIKLIITNNQLPKLFKKVDNNLVWIYKIE